MDPLDEVISMEILRPVLPVTAAWKPGGGALDAGASWIQKAVITFERHQWATLDLVDAHGNSVRYSLSNNENFRVAFDADIETEEVAERHPASPWPLSA